MKHLKLELERLEQRIAPGGVSCGGVIILACSQAARGMVENKASPYNYGGKKYVLVQVDAGVMTTQDTSMQF